MAFLSYEISIVGLDKARAAMRSIEAEAEGAGRRSILHDPTGRASGTWATAHAGSSRRASPDQDARAAAKAEREKTQAAVREAKQRASAEVALQRQRSSALWSNYKAEERNKSKTALAGIRASKLEEKAHDRAEREKSRATDREARTRKSAELSLNRQRSAALFAQHKKEESTRIRMAERIAEAEKRGKLEFARTTRGVFAGTASKAAAVGRGAIAATGLAGGALFATATHSAMAQHAAASNMANQLEGRNASAASLAKTKGEVLATARATRGFGAEQVIAGMSEFQAVAGEPEATKKIAPVLTETSLATGSSPEDIGKMDAALYASIRTAAGGAGKSVEQIIKEVERLNRVFSAMGQAGAIELKDIATIGPEIATVAQKFKGDQVSNLKEVGAWIQIVRQNVPSAAEASTALQNLPNDIITHSKEANVMMGATGQGSIYSDSSKTKLKSLRQLIPELVASTGGNLEKLNAITGIRGGRALAGFTDPYLEAHNAAKKSGKTEKQAREAGKAAVDARFEAFGGLEMSQGELKTKADSRMADADMMLAEQMRNLSTVVGEKLLPQLTLLIPSISRLVPSMAKLADVFVAAIDFISKAPVEAAFLGLANLFAIEIGKAAIGSVIASAFQRLVMGSMASTAASTVAGGVVATETAAVGAAVAGGIAAKGVAGTVATGGVIATEGAAGAGALGAGAAGAALLGGAAKGGFFKSASGSVFKNTTGMGMLKAGGIGLMAGTAIADYISAEGVSTFNESKSGTDEIMKGLSGSHGPQLGADLVGAEKALQKIKDEAGLFGDFMDLFGAGPEADIKGAETQIKQKRQEYDYFERTGQLTPEAQRDTEFRQKAAGANADPGASGSNGATGQGGQALEKAADKLSLAADRLSLAAGNGSPSVSLNTGNQPTKPSVK